MGQSSPIGGAPGVTVPFQRKKPSAIGTTRSYPGFIEPALAAPIEKVPGGERWFHEIKFDGYRVQVHVVNEAVKVFTRRGHDWTNRFRKIADDAWHVAARSAILDGEVVVPAADGSTDFSVLQNELKGQSTKIVLVAFDLVYLNGHDLRKLPLVERKAQLQKIIQHTDIQFSDSFEVDGAEVFAHACKVGLEGMVSKVRDSSYVSGRGNTWVKKTCAQRETLTIAGSLSMARIGTASMSGAVKVATWFMQAKLTTASTSDRPLTCASVSRH
jgi:bifunctional non-homologous end joining protein LigD